LAGSAGRCTGCAVGSLTAGATATARTPGSPISAETEHQTSGATVAARATGTTGTTAVAIAALRVTGPTVDTVGTHAADAAGTTAALQREQSRTATVAPRATVATGGTTFLGHGAGPTRAAVADEEAAVGMFGSPVADQCSGEIGYPRG
jgi:hypothetical protein